MIGKLLFLLYIPITAFGQSSNISDGPYVFYRAGLVYVKSVVEQNSDYKAVTDSFPERKKSAHILTVHVDKHPDWDFTVKVRSEITNSPSVTPGSDKTLILSDIEGEFEPFRNLLLAAHVIDSKYKWIFGKGNLIIAGDLFDRGKQVCQFLWLLYKLEGEAAKRGGAVHVILGNHDIMNLSGDFRYVEPKYRNNAVELNESYADLYANNTELGRWLRSKNIIEKVGDLLILHGGISPNVLQRKQTVSQINTNCRPFYDVSPRQIPDSLKVLLGVDGVFWYRGYFLEPKATMGLIDNTLTFFHARQIIVGHNIIDHVALLYDGKVIAVDVDEHEGIHEALLIRNNCYCRIDDKGNKQELNNL